MQNLIHDKTSRAWSSVTNQDQIVRPNLVADYSCSPVTQFGANVVKDVERFKTLNDEVRSRADFAGNSMLDIANRYFHEPGYAEKQRQEIEELRRKKKPGRR